MDTAKPEPIMDRPTVQPEPICTNFGHRGSSIESSPHAPRVSGTMPGSRATSTITSASAFSREGTPVDMTDTFKSYSSNNEPSDSQPNSPSVLVLDPGSSLVANSVVTVKSTYELMKPLTYTYNFSIVNNTAEPMELNYQPIMCQKEHHEFGVELEPAVPRMMYLSGCNSPSPVPVYNKVVEGETSSAASSEHEKAVIKKEPLDYSITMNEHLDSGSDDSPDFGDIHDQDTDLMFRHDTAERGESSPTLVDSDQKVNYVQQDIPALSKRKSLKKRSRPKKSSAAGTANKVSCEQQGTPALSRKKTLSPKISDGVSSAAGTANKVSSSLQTLIEQRCPTKSLGTMGNPSQMVTEPNITLGPESDVMSTDIGSGSKADWSQGCLTLQIGNLVPGMTGVSEEGEMSKQLNFPSTSSEYCASFAEGSTYSCHICGEAFEAADMLQKHLTSHLDKVHLTCEYCREKFQSMSSLTKHIQTHFNGDGVKASSTSVSDNVDSKLILCDFCGKSFKKLHALHNHLKAHSEQRPYKCEHCEKSYKTRDYLRRHIRTHTKEKRYVCEVCAKRFTEITALTCHRRIHTGEKPYKCNYCTESFRQMTALKHHVNSKHTHEKEYNCKECGKSYLSLSAKGRHKHMHQLKDNEKPYKCGTCDKAYRSKGALVVHLRTHTGEKPYKCTYCDHTFKRPNQRSVHQRLHTGEKPYKCGYCEKAFRQREPYKQHLNIHTGKRPYKCRFCEKTFASKATVYNHEKMHKKEAALKLSVVEESVRDSLNV